MAIPATHCERTETGGLLLEIEHEGVEFFHRTPITFESLEEMQEWFAKVLECAVLTHYGVTAGTA